MTHHMRFRPFEPKALNEIDIQDVESLIRPEPVPEGLFVEYKLDWTPKKTARAVASFANSPGGGTLVVGMEADKLIPTHLTGVQMNPGQLEEAAVSAIRALVAPTPAFRPRGLELKPGWSCLLVEVPQGTQPPYIYMPTGQVFERTPTSSDPVPVQNRDTLDRLFSAGLRGRSWASAEAERLIGDALIAAREPTIWVVPAVEGGLAAYRAIFRESTGERLVEVLRRTFVHQFLRQPPFASMGSDHIQATVEVAGGDEEVTMRLHANGVAIIRWRRPQVGAGDLTLVETAKRYLPEMAAILEETLGHFGEVQVALFNRWEVPSGGMRSVDLVIDPESMDRLRSSEFVDEVDRRVKRSLGDTAFEPEEPS